MCVFLIIRRSVYIFIYFFIIRHTLRVYDDGGQRGRVYVCICVCMCVCATRTKAAECIRYKSRYLYISLLLFGALRSLRQVGWQTVCISHVTGRQIVYGICDNTHVYVCFQLALSKIYGMQDGRMYVIGRQNVQVTCGNTQSQICEKKKKLLPFVALQSLWYVGRVNVCDRTAEFMYIYVTCGSTY